MHLITTLFAVGEIQKFLESCSLVQGVYLNVVVEGDELNNPGVLNHKFQNSYLVYCSRKLRRK